MCNGLAQVLALTLAVGVICGARRACGQTRPATSPASCPAASAPAVVDSLIDRLGDDGYQQRAAATRELLQAGPELIPALEARLATEGDAEIRFRLRFVIENLRPPQSAALVVRAEPDSGLQPGDLITHVNNRRVLGRADLLDRLRGAPGGARLQVRGPAGPREVGPIADLSLPTMLDYRAPRGPQVVRVVQLYHAGYVERAYELIRAWDTPLPPAEFSPLLHAIVAYTAGDAAAADAILAEGSQAGQPSALDSAALPDPALLDSTGPQEAPLYLKWRLWRAAGGDPEDGDPSAAVQRVGLPGNRFEEVLATAAEAWWSRYRGALGTDSDTDRVGGNMLAISAWMLSELDLLSECLWLVEPRSAILRRSSQGVQKWVRVQTDAWLPFVQGDPRGALDGFYEDARTILQPPGPPLSRRHIQNPRVAAQVAFFLYQFPDDQRVTDTLALVNHPDHPGFENYAFWMLYALGPENFDTIRRDLALMVPQAPDAQAGGLALAVALLEYVSGRADAAILEEALRRVASAGDNPQFAATAAIVTALQHLAAGRAAEARQALASAGDEPGAAALRATAEFLASPPDQFAIAAVPAPLLAVPLGRERRVWLFLTGDRELARFDADTGELTPLERPTPTWFPGPLNWPWLGYEPGCGRAWVYGRRRVLEIPSGAGAGLRLNIRTVDIAAFDRYVGSAFADLAASVAARPSEPEEFGELWRADLQTGGELFSDPELPEIGLVRALPNDTRIVHVGFRGGPHLLLDVTTNRVWGSAWMAEELGLAAPPRFLAQAVREQPAPVVFLLSDAGLIRFDVAAERVTRLALPGGEPYSAVVPESCPYVRRDPRWVYCARLPAEGGRVYRVSVADSQVEALEMVNEVLPRDYYALESRGELRARIDAVFVAAGLPPLRTLVVDAQATVTDYIEESRP